VPGPTRLELVTFSVTGLKRLSDRQAEALAYVLEQGNLTIREFESLFPEVNRRSLQRDLKAMVDRGLLVPEGATNKLTYRIRDTG
jgi:predicted HTH transcriptional regulator